MTESLIRENETHLYGPRGARKRHSKLARGPICCYFINQPASVGQGREVVTHLFFFFCLKIPHSAFTGPLEKKSSLCRKAAGKRIRLAQYQRERSSIRQCCAQEEFYLDANPLSKNDLEHVSMLAWRVGFVH